MRKHFLFIFSFITLCASAQMYLWQNGICTVAELDSITFHKPETGDPYEPLDPTEPLHGVFSVSATKQVRFSCGNLQYTRSTKSWSFATQQYETLGEANHVDNDLAETIDMYGWSGSEGEPFGVSISYYNKEYYGDFVDWGQNIGDGKTWHTLSDVEWNYLVLERPDAAQKQGIARIILSADGKEYVNGFILLPDDWTAPEGLEFKAGFMDDKDAEAYGKHQTFTIVQWKQLEQAGAVFFPTTGYSNGNVLRDNEKAGYYWSSTPYMDDYARVFYFDSDGARVYDEWYNARSDRSCVRLVQEL